MTKEKRTNLLLSIGICFTFAIIGGLLTGDALDNWFTEIIHPWFSLPLWAWYVVGGLYYFMAIVILYRLFNASKAFLPARQELRSKLAIWLTMFMIAGNELWNYLFFRLESTFAGFIGLLPFTLLVIVLFIILWKFQRFTAWILFPYLLWLGYDLIWTYHLWILNK